MLYAAENGQDTVVQLLLNQGAAIEVQENDGRTPLSYAAEHGYKHIVQLLLAQNANVDTEDNAGMTPFLWIIGIYASTLPYVSPIELNDNKALLNYQMHLMLLKQQNKKRLLLARFDSRPDGTLDDRMAIIQSMLAKDAKLNAKRNDGKTALMCAAEQGWDRVVQLLLDKGADIEAVDNNGKTALIVAAQRGWDRVVQLLLDKGADIEAEDNNGKTVRSYAAENRRDRIVQLLLDAAENRRDTNGYLLLDRDANIETNDINGNTLLVRHSEANAMRS